MNLRKCGERALVRTFLMLASLCLISTGSFAEDCSAKVCFEYLVKFSRQTTPDQIQSILRDRSLSELNYFESSGLYHLGAHGSSTSEETLKELNSLPEIIYAEPNYLIQAQITPNDPLFSDLWAFQNSGQFQGMSGIDMGMDSVWDMVGASDPIVVAVLDSGIDYLHEDLAPNIWINSDEIPGNGRDDDNNGYVDDVYGYNFFNNTSDPADDYFHGTHVAGIIGAVGNNGVGVAGIDWNVKLMALKFMGTDGKGPLSDAVEAINYAVRNGAKIINNSWAFTYPGLNHLPSPVEEPVYSLRDAIVAADHAGVIFVAAAGNEGADSDQIPTYPSAYSVGNILSVAATDNRDSLPPFSNYGVTTVDLGAPGVLIESTFPRWKETPPYHFLSGTSMAAPQVSGAAALLWSQNPSLTHRQIIDRLLQGVAPTPSLAGKTVTGGRLDLAESFAVGSNSNHPPLANAGANQSRKTGDSIVLMGTATDTDGDVPLTFRWTLTTPANETSSFNGSQLTFSADLVGTYTAVLVVGDGISLSLPSTVRVFVTATVGNDQVPMANGGPNQLRRVGDHVILRGSAIDADGDSLTYRWSLAVPSGSLSTLNAGTSAETSFNADVLGTYTATLVVSDGKSFSLPVPVKIYVTPPTVINNIPVARAGPDQLRRVGDNVLLHGSGTDPDGNLLSYKWALVKPLGSEAALTSLINSDTSFRADRAGTYTVNLVVSDGKSQSLPASARIFVLAVGASSASSNLSTGLGKDLPLLTVVITAQKEGEVSLLDPQEGGGIGTNQTLLLDASHSAIRDNAPLEFEWSLAEKPMGSQTEILNPQNVTASFVPDVEGRYTVSLLVTAGKLTSYTEQAFQAVANDLPQKSSGEASSTGTATSTAGGCSLRR